MRTNYFFLLILLLFSITSVSAASIGSFQLDVDDVEIYQTCNNCTSCNFTRVMGPNDQTILSNLEATKDGTYFSTTILKGNFTKVSDNYAYTYDCGNSAESLTGRITFGITYTGGDLDGSSVSVYIIAIIILFILFGLFLFFSTRLPNKDAMDEQGSILQVSNLKHLRTILYGVCWAILLAIVFIISNITLAYLPTTMIGDLFFAVYKIMFWLTIIALPMWFIWIFVGIFRDKEVKRMIERGVDIKGTP